MSLEFGVVLFFGAVMAIALLKRNAKKTKVPPKSIAPLERTAPSPDDSPDPDLRSLIPKPDFHREQNARPHHGKGDRAPQTVPASQVLRGKCYVEDGDTIYIDRQSIRLFGIDAPEMNHPYGKAAKWAMVKLCKGQTIRAEVYSSDPYGRLVAKCFLPDGRDISAELVKQGLAIDWKKHSGGIYRQYETPDARKRLWRAVARQQGRQRD